MIFDCFWDRREKMETKKTKKKMTMRRKMKRWVMVMVNQEAYSNK